MEGVSIIGPGRLGGALALAIDRAGRSLDSIVYNHAASANLIAGAVVNSKPALVAFDDLSSIDSPVVLIASRDPEIAGIASALSNFIRRGTVVLHTSGSLSSEIMAKVRDAGGIIGSMHPLVSISEPLVGAERFNGVYFCIEGEAPAVDAATAIALDLGGIPFSIATQHKALYHAAAVTASGHLVSVIDAAIEMLAACDIEADTAKEILLPLIVSTIDNLRTQTPAEALTGTFARADVEAFERHLSAMEDKVASDTVELYLLIAERSLRLAEKQGVDKEKTALIRNRISIAKRNRG